MADDELRIELCGAGGEPLVFDFRDRVADLQEYADRFGLTLREAAQAAVNNLLENAALDPQALVRLLDRDPWVFRFELREGRSVEVDLNKYSEKIEALTREKHLPVAKAAKLLLLENIDELRPTLRWLNPDGSPEA